MNRDTLSSIASGAQAYGKFRANVIFWIITVLSLIGSGLALYLIVRPQPVRLFAKGTIDTVDECTETKEADGKSTYTCKQTVSFTAQDGKTHKASITRFALSSKPAVKDPIELEYEASDPAKTAQPKSALSLRTVGLIILGVSVGMFLLALLQKYLVSRFAFFGTVYGGASAVSDIKNILD